MRRSKVCTQYHWGTDLVHAAFATVGNVPYHLPYRRVVALVGIDVKQVLF